MTLKVLILLAYLSTSLASDDDDLDIVTEAPIPVTDVETVVGSSARLPCDLTLPTDHDRVSLIIWYKDGAKTPIYSLDVREKGLGQGREVKQTEGQLSYVTNFPESALVLEAVRPQDRGLYKCRVDFKHSPTRHAHVNLSVVEPASRVFLTDSSGATLQQSTLGPVVQDSLLEVVCAADGGWPSPRLTWWQDNDMVDDSMDQPQNNRVSNTLTIQRVSRDLLESRLECRASSTPLLDPVVVFLSLDILLVPLEVRLVGENLPLSAGSVYEVACRNVGSKPAPSITWWRAGKLLDASSRVVTSEDQNVTTSTVSLTASREDDGHVLSCRAANPHVPTLLIEDSWTLDIHYRPVAAVRVGSSLNATHIREGVDVYLECRVDANPRPARVLWSHNSQPVISNTSAGVLVSNHTLVLQAVRRESSGAYSCTAANHEGQTTSQPYTLNIKYEPRCKESQQKVYGAARLEEVLISCEVDANPPTTAFRWSFNNSVVQERRLESHSSGDRSEAKYTAFSETDFGTVLCWGSNDVGTQTLPCVFHVVPAGVPDSPHNCSVTNRSQSWVHVACKAGFDGGLPQQFTAEVWRLGAVAGGGVVSNSTSRSGPQFTLTSLEPGVAYSVLVYSSNAKGRSGQGVTIETSTLGHTQVHRRTTELSLPTLEPMTLVVSGIVIGVLLMIGVVLVAVVCVKRHSLQGSPEVSSVQLDKTHSLLSVTVPSTTIDDDRNPDVVPHTTEVETTLITASSDSTIDAQWVSSCGLALGGGTTVTLPKEAVFAESWGVSVWPGNTAIQKCGPPVHRHAGTQTSQHRESAV